MKRALILLLVTLIPAVALAADPRIHFTSATPVVDTNIYASGDAIGDVMTFTNAVSQQSEAGFLTSVMIYDKSAQASDLDLVLFCDDPESTAGGSSTVTDQAAFDPSDASVFKELATISLGSATRYNYVDNGVKFLGSLLIPVRNCGSADSKSIYGVIVSRGTPTFAASGDLKVVLGISWD